MKLAKQKTKNIKFKIIFSLFFIFLGSYYPAFAEVTTTYSNGLNSSSAFEYRSDYTGNSYMFNEPLGWYGEEDVGLAWKYYTLPETIINTSSLGHLKLKAIDTSLSYSYIVDGSNTPFSVCGNNTISYYFYSLPEVWPTDNEVGDRVYTFNKNDYIFRLTPEPRRHIAQSATEANSLNSDGTCPYRIYINGTNIPADNYFGVAFNSANETGGYAIDWVSPSASDTEMTTENYETRPYTLAGYGYSPLQAGQTMALGSNVQDTDIVGCNSETSCGYYKNTVSADNIIQPDFYITTDISAPPVNDINSCNPFSSNISTAFLNLDFSLSDCLQDIASFLFIPSTESTSLFSDLSDTIKQKPPFGWIVGIFNSLESINPETATATFTLEQVTPITTVIFDPIRTALSWLFYFIFAFYLFNRFKDIII